MKKKPTRKNKTTKSKVLPSEPCPTWVDRVMEDWKPIVVQDATESSSPVDEINDGASAATTTEESLSVGILCWNVLADSYCSRRSHRHLPLVYQNHVFDRHKRQNHVRQILKRFATGNLAPDIITLQEVDEPLGVPACMEECGYRGHHTPTDISGKHGRVDSCALYYRTDSWKSVIVESIRLDDLATLCTKNRAGNFSASTRASLIGIESSFLRKNMALLVRLQHLETRQEIVVAVSHLFWNPLYQDVKLCQAHHVATRAYAFANGSPILFAGDTNSQPGSAVHHYFTKGIVNAKAIAPWYDKNPFRYQDNPLNGNDDEEELVNSMDQLLSVEDSSDRSDVTSGAPRYLLDFTLNRLCRWLRILGVDAALETEEEERMRTKFGTMTIFERCRNERRTLVTSSNRLVMRKDCPPGTYRLDTKALSNLELSLVHLLLCHGVELEPQKFLSICVVCNGRIDRVEDKATIEGIFIAHKAPDNLINQELKVWQCSGCKQGYWYDERPTSSASRVKNQATKLLILCIRGGVPVVGDMDLFDFIDIESTRNEPVPDVDDEELCSLKGQRLDVLEWLQQDELRSALGPLKSAYGGQDGHEQLQFTNVTSDFVGHLDYIFHDCNFCVSKHLYVPTTFEELQDGTDVRNGHLLPSNVWPSDHLAIGAVLTLSRSDVVMDSTSKVSDLMATVNELSVSALESGATTTTSESLASMDPSRFCLPVGAIPNLTVSSAPDKAHGQRCGCGCVPNVMSLFEMAEARRKAREARKEVATKEN